MMNDKESRVVGIVYRVSMGYETVYEDLSHTDWDYLEKKAEEKKKTIGELLNG